MVQLSSNAGQSWSSAAVAGSPGGRPEHRRSRRDHCRAHRRCARHGTAAHQRCRPELAGAPPVPLAIPTDQADLAISADASRVAVLASVPGSANDGATPELLVRHRDRLAGHPLGTGQRQHRLGRQPVAAGRRPAQLAAVRQRRQRGQLGCPPGRRPGRAALQPRPEHPEHRHAAGQPDRLGAATGHQPPADGTASVQFYRSSNGASFTADVRVPLASRLGPGTSAVVSTAGPTGYLVAEPGSTLLHLVSTGTGQTDHPPGRPARPGGLAVVHRRPARAGPGHRPILQR